MKEPKLLDDKRLNILLDKYGNLLHTIANKISGDPGRDHDDYYQELIMEFIPAIQGFETKVREGIVKGYETNTQAKFEEYVNWKPFDQYLKTVVWNYKNRVGASITQKYLSNGVSNEFETDNYNSFEEDLESFNKKKKLKIRNKSYNFEFNEDGIMVHPIEDKRSSIDLAHYFNEIKYKFTAKEKELLSVLLNNPSETMFSDGKINITGVAKQLKLTHYEARDLIVNFSLKIEIEIL